MKRDLIPLENKYHLGEDKYTDDGNIDHKALIIDRLFKGPQSSQLLSKPQCKPWLKENPLGPSLLLSQTKNFLTILKQDNAELMADPEKLNKVKIEDVKFEKVDVTTTSMK